MKNNIVGWFEIPVSDMERAVSFYETILSVKLTRNQIASHQMALFPWIEDGLGSSGALISQNEYFVPGNTGVLVYLSSPSGDIANELARIPAAGGTVLVEKELITEEIGYWGLFIDTEGNKIGMHSRK